MFDPIESVRLFRQIEWVRDFNAIIVSRINRARQEINGLEPAVNEYLQSRARVFHSFVAAAQKIADAIRRSGPVLLFQLKFEVERLTYLTFRGIGQFREFLSIQIEKNPVVRRNPVVLREMEELRADIANFRESIQQRNFSMRPIDPLDSEPCIATCDGIKIL